MLNVRDMKRSFAFILALTFTLVACFSMLGTQKANAWGEDKNGIHYYIHKVDENGDPVPGATFHFDATLDWNGYKLDTSCFSWDHGPNEIIEEWTIEEGHDGYSPELMTENPGDDATLIISETGVPEGYEKAEDVVIKFDDSSTGWVGTINGVPYTGWEFPTITFVNKFKRHEVKIAKRTEAGDLLNGAELEITGTMFNGKAIDSIKITDTSAVSTQKLPAGEYTLKETRVPGGYLKADDISFKVDYNGIVTVNGEQVGEVVMTDLKEKKPKLSVKKTSNVTKASPGDVIPFEITVTNSGDGDAEDVNVLDTMGEDLEYVSDDSKGVAEGNKVEWLVDVAAGETKVITINCRIKESAKGKVINNVEITNYEDEASDTREDEFEIELAEEKQEKEKSKKTDDKKKIVTKAQKIKKAASPKTGDEFGLALWAITTALSGLFVLGGVHTRKIRQ